MKGLNFPKKIRLNHLFAIVIVCMFAFTSVGFILGSNGNGGTFTLSAGIYPGAPSYTIWHEDDVYYAKNAYGVIDYSGTNASSVITNCISNFTTITFTATQGSYDPIIITHSIVLENYTRYVTFQGESITAYTLELADAADCDMFQVEAGCHYIVWNKLYMHGNNLEQSSTSHGIHFLVGDTTTSDCQIIECTIVNFYGSPVYIEGTVSASYIYGNYMEDSEGATIRIGGLHGSTIKHNILWGSAYGIQVENTSRPRQDNIFEGNYINDMSVAAMHFNTSHNNMIINNHITTCTVGIFINVMYYSQICGNWIITIDETGMLMYSLQFDTVSDNNVYGCSQDTNATYSGIIMGAPASGQCNTNIINTNMVSNQNWDNKTVYGIAVYGTYNILTDCSATGSNCNIFESGTANEVHDCYNGTAYIS